MLNDAPSNADAARPPGLMHISGECLASNCQVAVLKTGKYDVYAAIFFYNYSLMQRKINGKNKGCLCCAYSLMDKRNGIKKGTKGSKKILILVFLLPAWTRGK